MRVGDFKARAPLQSRACGKGEFPLVLLKASFYKPVVDRLLIDTDQSSSCEGRTMCSRLFCHKL